MNYSDMSSKPINEQELELEVDELQQKIKQLEADRDRMDWLEKLYTRLELCGAPNISRYNNAPLREAIDKHREDK